jgi:hypothetical protein
MVRILGILGPLIAAIGAGILILDVIRNQSVRWAFYVDFPNYRRKVENERHKRRLKQWEDMPDTYPEDYRQKYIAEEIELHDKTLQKEEDYLVKADFNERKLSSKIAIVGFIFIVVGSLMQSLGAYLAP